MKTWIGTITATFYQDVCVEAETKEEAEQMMFERFNVGKAECQECNLFDIEEVTNQGESNHVENI